jgi:predicted nucleic acid-binding protein
MPAEALFVDTNVLVEATDVARRHHRAARRLIETHPRLVFSAQVVREYLVVATRPAAVNGLGLSTAHALDNVRAFRECIRLLPEEKPLLPVLLRLIEEVGCAGKRIHDAHVVATALAHGVSELVTLNTADFAAFSAKLEMISLIDAAART